MSQQAICREQNGLTLSRDPSLTEAFTSGNARSGFFVLHNEHFPRRGERVAEGIVVPSIQGHLRNYASAHLTSGISSPRRD
jgi:hypothetical protein